jgi:uncharacterized membrane protein
MRLALIAAATLLLPACGSREDAADAPTPEAAEVPISSAVPTPSSANQAAPPGRPAGNEAAQLEQPPAGPGTPCLMQGSERLSVRPQRAVGTEPFWSARVEGRCVLYSQPEDQDGTRVWTRYAKGPDGEIWSGALDGQAFELRTRAKPGCSDGMSDKSYPLAVSLTVRGEQRTGCAELI